MSEVALPGYRSFHQATLAIGDAAAIAFVAPLFGASNFRRLLQSPRQTKASGFLRNRTLIGTPLSVPRIRCDA